MAVTSNIFPINRTFLFLTAAVIAALSAAAQQPSPSLSTEAQRAYMQGDIETAKQKFTMILAEDPNNVTARNYLRDIARTQAAEAAAGGGLRKQLQILMIPSVEFKDATLREALDRLKELASKASGGKVEPNFVLKPEVNAAAPVTLHMSNMPFTELLRYIGQLTNADFSVEQYAIVVKSRADSK